MADDESRVANERASRLYDSPGFRGAYVRGAQAALAGRDKNACPYGTEGWRRTFRLAWMRGWYSIVGPAGELEK